MIDVLSSSPGASPIVIEAVFPATALRLFDAWTKADQIRKWFGTDPDRLKDVQIDLREGGHWRFVMDTDENREESLEGRYLEIMPGERLTFSWCHVVETASGEREETPPSQVTILFEPMGAATRLTLEHREITSDGGRRGVRAGWITSFKALADFTQVALRIHPPMLSQSLSHCST